MPGFPASSGPAGGSVPAVLLAAKAAATAAAQPSVPAGQWVYTKTVTSTTTLSCSRICAVKNGKGHVHDVALPGFLSQPRVPPGRTCLLWSNGLVGIGNYHGGTPLPRGNRVTLTGKGTVVAVELPREHG